MAINADPTKNTGNARAADEGTPLLGAPDTVGGQAVQPNGHAIDSTKPLSDDASQNNSPDAVEEDKPIPYAQVLALCYASLVEPISYFSIFPYIQDMVEKTGGVAVEDVGFWTGLIESLFSLIQMLLMIFYGRLADRLGRKPVLIFSLAGVAGASTLFGLSANLWQMVLFRCVAGLFAGSSVTIRAMLSENTTKKTQARVFSWYMFARNLGLFIGPLIGGPLANPTTQYSAFKNVQFFKDYPYALPAIVTGGVCMSTVIIGIFILNETLVRKVDGSGSPEPPMTTWELLKAPGVTPVLLLYGQIMVQGLAYTAINPVFLYTPISLGGVGFSPSLIALSITVAGASQSLWMLFAFPPLQRKLSTGGLLRICSTGWVLLMALFPIYNELRRAGFDVAFWILGAFGLIVGSGVAMGYACLQLCLNDISPSPQVFGTLNAVALTINSGVRTVTPMAITSVYATGVRYHILHGHLAWVVMVLLTSSYVFFLRYLPEKAEGRVDAKKTVQAEEE